MSIDIRFAGGLIIRLENILVLLICFLLHHDVLLGFYRVTMQRLQLLSFQMVLGCGKLPLPFNLVHLGHDLPAESLVKLCVKCLRGDSLHWQRIFTHKNH